ncbi:MAG: ATP-binding protein [Elusimicrobia bacterium]|nr:ATP-binding protein [Elusimicrobiota bacterium]
MRSANPADKRLIDELAELDFIDRGQSVVFIGQPAVGKSAVAESLGLFSLAEVGHFSLALGD